MPRTKKTKRYEARATWEHRGTVAVEARSPSEAAEKFGRLDDTEFFDAAAELINWEAGEFTEED